MSATTQGRTTYVAMLLERAGTGAFDARVQRAWTIYRQGKAVIEHFAEGLSVRDSAARIGVSRQTVHRLRRKFELTNNRGRK